MKKLFEDFKSIDKKAWLNQIEKDLKGKSIDLLTTKPENDLEIVAYHHRDDFPSSDPVYSTAINHGKSNNEWLIRRMYSETTSNQEILADLNSGVNAIGLLVSDPDRAKDQIKDVQFEYISADLKITDPSILNELDVIPDNLNFDLIGDHLKTGKTINSLDEFCTFYKRYPNKSTIWVSGHIYGNAGASTVQELAFTLSHLNEYLQALKDQSIPLLATNHINIELSVSSNYFVNIAKFRVIKELIAHLFEGYSLESHPEIKIYATTGVRFLTQNDHNTNFLRETTQAMSAILGGCDYLTITPLQSIHKDDNELNKHLAKNIQLVLKEEAYLDKVIDPSAGSYFIESLTDQLMDKAWQLFLEIENEGGLIQSAKENWLQERIDRNRAKIIDGLNNKKITLLGVNKYQNSMEDWKTVERDEKSVASDFFPLHHFEAEAYFENNIVGHE